MWHIDYIVNRYIYHLENDVCTGTLSVHMLRNFNVHYGNTSQFGCLQTKQNLLPNKWQKSINNETKPSFSMNFWFNL